jgi:hypothetical protein
MMARADALAVVLSGSGQSAKREVRIMVHPLMTRQATGTYAWVITVDKLDSGASVGVSGPGGATDDQLALAAKGRVFRLRDDDGIVYFHGRIWNDPITGEGSEDDFGPLEDYGEAFGCTEIQYRTGTTWETL